MADGSGRKAREQRRILIERILEQRNRARKDLAEAILARRKAERKLRALRESLAPGTDDTET